MSKLLELKGVHKYFEHKGYIVKVLNGIDLSICESKTIAITGASGSGKTTLLNIMGGLERPTKGRVIFLNRDLYHIGEKELNLLRNKKIGFIFQFHYLMPELTAIENVMMPVLISGYSRKEAYKIAFNMLSQLGLKDRINHKPGELSGGEQQRVAIARSCVMNPKLILADEPTGNLDRKMSKKVIELLLELNKEKGVAIVMATHNLEIANMMEKSLELKDGKLLEI